MLNLIGIKTPKGIFISNFNEKDSYRRYTNVNNFKINGELPKHSFDNGWSIVSEEPEIITQKQSPTKENYRYILKDESIASEKIPLVLLREVVATYDKEDYEWVWNSEYRHLISLYELKYDEVEQADLKIDFTYNQIVETDDFKEIKNFDWDIYRTQWTHEGTRKVTKGDLKYQIIDKIMFPNIYYEEKCPVTLPSKTLYDIIRFYIKNNIDLKIAEITSDYDFCFTVKKRIKRIEPLTVKTEQLKNNGRSYRPPKFTTKTHQYASSYEVFKMTHNEKNYDGYPTLPDLIAKNTDELQQKVDKLLKDLIEFINEPVSICPHCNGTGLEHETKTMEFSELIK